MTNRNRIRTLVGAALLAVGTGAFAQADNSNSATDPTYYGAWYYFDATPGATVETWTYRDYVTPRWHVYGPTVTYYGPAYYDSWYYFRPPQSGTVTALGTITDPAYSGPRDVSK
jgi:hypothetical protein